MGGQVLGYLLDHKSDVQVQRLDQPTGSPVMVAKSRPVLSALSAAFLYHEVKKTHLALICGR